MEAAEAIALVKGHIEHELLLRNDLFFLHHASRRVHLAGITTNPDGPWISRLRGTKRWTTAAA